MFLHRLALHLRRMNETLDAIKVAVTSHSQYGSSPVTTNQEFSNVVGEDLHKPKMIVDSYKHSAIATASPSLMPAEFRSLESDAQRPFSGQGRKGMKTASAGKPQMMTESQWKGLASIEARRREVPSAARASLSPVVKASRHFSIAPNGEDHLSDAAGGNISPLRGRISSEARGGSEVIAAGRASGSQSPIAQDRRYRYHSSQDKGGLRGRAENDIQGLRSEEQGTVLPATLDVQAPVGTRPARTNRSKVELSKAAVADAVGTVDEASRRGKAVDSMLGPLLVRVARPVSTLSQPQRADQSGQFRRLKDSSA